ncbi:MAG: hypothetical protein AAGK14_04120 [Verrucomicrobiota bacterium]
MEEKIPDIIENLEMVSAPDPYAWLWWTLGVLAVAGIAGAVVYHLYRKKKLPFQEKPPIPPDVIALEQLGKIRPLMDEGKVREFVLAVSKVLRYYIEGRFGVKAPHLSTEEFLFHAEKSDRLPLEYRPQLEDFLRQCDRVKFALANMEQPQLQGLYETTESFVLQTREMPKEPEEAKEAAPPETAEATP